MRKKYTFEFVEKVIREVVDLYGTKVTVKQYENWRKNNRNYPSSVTITSMYGSFKEAKRESLRVFKYFKKSDCYEAIVCFNKETKSFSRTKYKTWQRRNFFQPTYQEIINIFGNWEKAIEKSKKELNIKLKVNHHGSEINKEYLILSLQKVAKVLGAEFSKRDYEKLRGKIEEKLPCSRIFPKHFGSWENAKLKAGLKMSQLYITKYSKEDCILSLQEASKTIGERVSMEAYDKWRKVNRGHARSETIQDKFGKWSTAIKKANLKIGVKSKVS